jgi:Zn-dependent protease
MKTSWKAGTLLGKPVSVHASLPVTLLLATVARPQGLFALGVVLVLMAHLAGHLVAARLAGLRILRVELDGLGGRCVSSSLASRPRRVLVASGGVLAQLVLMIAAVAADILAGYPQPAAWGDLLAALTTANALMLVCALLPLPGNDGGELWSFVADRSPTWEARAERRWGKPSARAAKAPQFPQTADGEPSPELQAYLEEMLHKPRGEHDDVN